MPIYCPSCESEIPSADVDLAGRVAKCARCNEVFAFQVPGAEPRPDDDEREPDRVLPPIPDGLRIQDDGFTRTLTRRWFTPAAIFLIFFCVFWDGFLFVWYGIALGGLGNGPGGGFNVVMVLFPLLHVAVGVGLTYYTICLFVNRTEVRVADGTLRVYHGPLPWFGKQTLPTADVTALYCEATVHQGKRGTRLSYSVKAIAGGERAVVLLSGLDSLTTAKFYEYQLEEWLELPPARVPGEAE